MRKTFEVRAHRFVLSVIATLAMVFGLCLTAGFADEVLVEPDTDDGAIVTVQGDEEEGETSVEAQDALEPEDELAVAPQAEGDITYKSEYGNQTINSTMYFEVTNGGPTTWSRDTNADDSTPAYWGYYVVKGDVTINSLITVSCKSGENKSVKLILADGATLRAKGGIKIQSGTSLWIYDQGTGNSGTLEVTGVDGHQDKSLQPVPSTPGISVESGGLYVYGGKITAKGGSGAAGAYINNASPGISLEPGSSISQFYLYGGSVTATGGNSVVVGGTAEPGGPAGVGGGWHSYVSGSKSVQVYVYGGTLTATGGGGGGNGNAPGGAGIGGGFGGNGRGLTLYVNGGKVVATGVGGGAGIGGGCLDDTSEPSNPVGAEGGRVVVKGGTVKATGNGGGAGIGGGWGGDAFKFEIYGGTVTATGNVAIGAGAKGRGQSRYHGEVTLGEGVIVKAGNDKASAQDVTTTFADSHTQTWVQATNPENPGEADEPEEPGGTDNPGGTDDQQPSNAKAANGMTVKTKTGELLFSKIKKKDQRTTALVTVNNANGAVTISKVSCPKGLSVDGSGRVTVKKGTKKGTYKVKLKVSAAGDATHNSAEQQVTVKVKVVGKLTNPMSLTGKTAKIKASKVKKKKQSIVINKLVGVKSAKGKVTYAKASGNKKITVASNGKVTAKKGLKAGTYTVKIKVTAAGNTSYKKATKTVACKVIVK